MKNTASTGFVQALFAVTWLFSVLLLTGCESTPDVDVPDDQLAKSLENQTIITGRDFAVNRGEKFMTTECPNLLTGTLPVKLKFRFRQDDKRMFSQHYKLVERLIKAGMVKPILSKTKATESAILYSDILRTERPGVYCWILKMMDPSNERVTWLRYFFFRDIRLRKQERE